MVDNSKVLAVSYGTFSCRLEGFEDSVETMKTVVAYFHELAGHDRFMDLEPQAPDMETLAALTQEQEDAPVDVSAEEGSVSLRVKRPTEDEVERPSLRISRPEPEETDADAENDPMVASSMLAAALRETTPQIIEDDDLDAELAEEIAEDDDILGGDDDIEADGVVEDVVAENDPVDAYDSEDDLYEEEDEHVEDVAVAEPEDLESEAEYEAELEDVEEAEDHTEVVAEQESAPTDDAPFYDPNSDEGVSEEADSVAAKLQRIRAVVSRIAPKPDENATLSGGPMMLGDEDRSAEDPEEIVDDFEFEIDDDLAPQDNAEDDDDPLFAEEDTPDEDPVAEDDAPRERDLDDEVRREIAAADLEIARRKDHSRLADLPENDDDAMQRIIDQADERLNESEGRRHRDAFAQLKAAVAATEAARQLGDDSADEDAEDVFRHDLDDVVGNGEGEVEPENRSVSTPLKLVASQRIEDEDAVPDDPAARLRKIAAVKTAPAETSGGFAEFAAENGATELGDLLEAAAAYIAFVEGDDDFSRPQVMKKVQQASQSDFSREDGLRSFGRLLRQSRIVKLSNGRFQVSENTRFRPNDQAAG